MVLQRRRPPNRVERKIHFFRAHVGVDGRGHPIEFDPVPAMMAIQNLPFAVDGRYMPEVEGNFLCVLPHSGHPIPTMRFCRTRRTGLPQEERDGNIRELPLHPDAGLLESIHVMFFPGNIVGAEYNHFGPRMSRLGYYLYVKSDQAVPLATFRPILRRDAQRQLERLREIRLLELSVLPAFVAQVRQADETLGDALMANRQLFGNQNKYRVIIEPQPNSRRAALNEMLGSLRRIIRRDDALEGIETFHIRGKCRDTNRVETIDLLSDHLISSRRIVQLSRRGRALDSDSAFQAIQEAYQELADDLIELGDVGQ